ncbi:translation factor SUA5 [Pelagirhabdus alkalitolerans]|uniref:Threonylcarbamoyl-AMP synthase n=1 Tax=Pelagirhabdus alkalitolerans TaxID=1612202 RepID=A0A1G6GI10_9BACI|nr:L-threonylcarbamoyladenylate synthase [Pelagirhabdus alkalitolerans]SDB81483.1 translation factor SUA5 [Pelagirhabdus alkalitolerans]
MTKSTNYLIWDDEAINICSELLKKGEVVAFPTETVYGLGADATNDEAVKKIFEAKGRPADNPLIVHVASQEQMAQYVDHIPKVAKQLLDAFTPGPLTVILPSNGLISPFVTAGLETIGLRIPEHPAALELIEKANLPIAAPSANLSGKTSPTSAIHVYQDLDKRISAILDGGVTGVGVESTVVDCTTDVPRILRPGGITRLEIEAVLDQVIEDATVDDDINKPQAPGMKYNHYEPAVPLVLVKGDPDFFQEKIDEYKQMGKKVGVLASEERSTQLNVEKIETCGTLSDLSTVARDLYQVLRRFKETDVDLILAEYFPEEAVGYAIMNRLKKAATYIELKETMKK